MENALFYTFSTIAQTLAAAIALLGAFALYRLQAIGVALDDLASSLIQPYLPHDTALRLYGEGDFAALATFLQDAVPTNQENANAPLYLGRRRAFAHHLNTLASIRRLLKWNFAVTVIVIAASVILLCLTPTLITIAGAPQLALSVGAVMFISCLVFQAMFVLRALK